MNLVAGFITDFGLARPAATASSSLPAWQGGVIMTSLALINALLLLRVPAVIDWQGVNALAPSN